MLKKIVVCSFPGHKKMPTTMLYIYHHAFIKSSRNFYTACSQKKNATFVKNITQSYKVHNRINTHSQCYTSRKYFHVQKDFLQVQRQGVNQICHYHCAINSRNPAHGGCLKQLASPRHQYLFAVPCRHISLAWLDSLAVTQAGWFRALGQSRLVENLMEGLQAIHDYSHLPWWGSIILSTILMRSILTFPFAVYQKYIMAKVENLKPEMSELVQELKKETAYAVRKYGWNEKHARYMFNRSAKKMWRELIIRDNCHPFKASAVLWVQLPLWISMSVSLRNMASMMPHQDTAAQVLFMQLSTGGFGWIPNLTDVDHSLILPVLMGLTNLLIIEISALSRIQEGSRIQKIATNVFRVISVAMIPIASAVPSCVALYWVTSSVCGLLQNLLLMHPGLNRALRLPPVASHLQQPYSHLWLQLLKKVSRKGNAQE
ncbi:hypothetical protein O3P69_020906 [Scylla paramamosain]|uniref:Membrane insertase YidC/Oxa/ALB C-terminal domain-containing protein n=1 Tax=Scylla paramamosain TaxID=85552 RepID=A0AAW0TPB5_SCYPA